jgi:hypothetical protein
MWQRLSDALFRLNIPSLTSMPAAAAALLICAAVVALKVQQAPQSSSSSIVQAPAMAEPSVLEQISAQRVANSFSLSAPIPTRSLGPDLSHKLNERAYTHRASTPPRYVLDRLPVSYEPSFNF